MCGVSVRVAFVSLLAARRCLAVAPGFADTYSLRVDWPMDGHKPLAELPFFKWAGTAGQARLLECAESFRARTQRRPLFKWTNPIPQDQPIKVYVRPVRWLQPGQTLRTSCPVACEYAKDASSADVVMANLRNNKAASTLAHLSRANKKKSTIAARLSYESCSGFSCIDFEGKDIVLSYSRHSDVVYEFFRRSDINWRSRPMPKRPQAPSSVVLISHCVAWRIDYLQALADAGVDIKFAGNCHHNYDTGNCSRPYAFHSCTVDILRSAPFAITFENYLLDDYVTEKWAHMWISGMIPVYAGSPLIYEKEVTYPPFVNVLDFEGPAHLAAYLHEIVKNDTLWAYYTQRHPVVASSVSEAKRWDSIKLDQHVCDVCMAARSSAT